MSPFHVLLLKILVICSSISAVYSCHLLYISYLRFNNTASHFKTESLTITPRKTGLRCTTFVNL